MMSQNDLVLSYGELITGTIVIIVVTMDSIAIVVIVGLKRPSKQAH